MWRDDSGDSAYPLEAVEDQVELELEHELELELLLVARSCDVLFGELGRDG